MLTYYCPHCWAIIAEDAAVCPHCGYPLEAFDALAYEDKLLAALHHTIPERRIMAAQILGNRKSLRALSEFEQIIASGETNYFLMRAVLLAVAKSASPDRRRLLEMAARSPSALVAALAKELLTRLDQNPAFDAWDRCPG